MRAYLSPPTSFHHNLNPHSLLFKPITLNLSHPQKPTKQNFQKTRKFSALQPSCLIPPPSFTLNHQLNPSNVPLSLRLLQLKRKNDKLAHTKLANPSELGSIGNAVWTLASMLENLQMSALQAEDKEILDRVSRDGKSSIVWLFQRVFSSSPQIAIGLLVMMMEFMVKSLDGFVCGIGSMIFESEERVSGGCLEVGDDLCVDYVKRRVFYENLIVTGQRDSMILSNYAQFLYLFENDIERANDYFSLSVKSEPIDAEAISRYAIFLWRARGDNERAEEMFQEAIRVDRDNSYHLSMYVWFLNETGSTDTCYRLTGHTRDDDDEEEYEELSSL